MVPEARAAMDRFKMEAASDVGAAELEKQTGPCLHIRKGNRLRYARKRHAPAGNVSFLRKTSKFRIWFGKGESH
ncbi:MAG: small, acid-soluble spore protein, alpha/beta type [Butyricicoccus sp.]